MVDVRAVEKGFGEGSGRIHVLKQVHLQARSGEIKNFTGISAPYEEPQNADLVLDTARPLALAVTTLTEYIEGIFGELPWHPDI